MTAPLLRWTTSALFFAAVVSILTILMACGGESPDAAQDRAPRESVPSTEAADPTPEPTATPEPTPMAEPTATPEPTPTIEPMATPEPTPTIEPMATPEPTPTIEPMATPEPTPTIEPMATPEPSPTMAPTPSPDLTDRDILEVFYNATDGPNWANNENWLSDRPLGEWFGVTVDGGGNLTVLALSSNGLQGELVPELAGLQSLEVVHISFNEISGGIPRELGNLSNLRILWLVGNSLAGEIPPDLVKLTHLKELELGRNQLTGVIPAQIGNLINLTRLGMNRNRLTGPLPRSLGNLSRLEFLSASKNELTGELPAELGNLKNLEILYLDRNQLSGEIPGEWGNMASLRILKILGNSIEGCIPGALKDGLDPAYFDTNLETMTFCEVPAGNGTAAVPTTTPEAQQEVEEKTVYRVDLTTLVGPASSPELGDENGNVPLDALERHRWIYESDYYQSLVEKANLNDPTRLTSVGQKIVIEHVCGHGDISPCVLLRDFFAPNLLERTEGQVNFQVVTYREARANASRILAALLDGGVDSATIYSWVLPEGRIQFLLGLYQSSELEFQATQAVIPDLEKAHETASNGVAFSRSWVPGGDLYLFCAEEPSSPEDLRDKVIYGEANWVEGMGATHRQLVSGTGEMFAALNEGNVDCIATTAGTGHDNHSGLRPATWGAHS